MQAYTFYIFFTRASTKGGRHFTCQQNTTQGIYTVHGISNIYRVGFRQKYNIYSISLIVLSYGLSETMGNSGAGERRCPCRYCIYLLSDCYTFTFNSLSLSRYLRLSFKSANEKTLLFMKCTKIDQIAIHLIIFVPGRSSTRAPA